MPDIEQMGESPYMGFDLCNLDTPFSPIPTPNPGFDPDALVKENSQMETKDRN
jgi:hypothetical protein